MIGKPEFIFWSRESCGGMIQRSEFRPGNIWTDTDGNPIQAHGGGILYDRGIYYWFGENKDKETQDHVLRRVDVIGINCYSSRDLYHWRYEGLALGAERENAGSDLHPSKAVERPKVIYNETTGKYVMWLHIDTPDYATARAGVAVSDTPAGPYRYLGSQRPLGAESRDMTVFKDEDGQAYLLHASEGNRTMHIVRLSRDYLEPTGEAVRVFIGQSREAPAVFKHDGLYYMITSYCTGWEPNAAQYAVSESMMGEWRTIGNPCLGTPEQVLTTFNAQGTFVLPVPNLPQGYIFMADRWNSEDLRDSRYVWLPLEVEGETVRIIWRDAWDLGWNAGSAHHQF